MAETISAENLNFSKEKIIEALYQRLSTLQHIVNMKCRDDFDTGLNYMASQEIEWLEVFLNSIERD